VVTDGLGLNTTRSLMNECVWGVGLLALGWLGLAWRFFFDFQEQIQIGG
jgi:hypothetical protein